MATSLMEWEAAAVRVHLPEQGDSGHITRGVGGCSCPGSSAGAGRQWPHHSWSGRLHLSGFICRSRETVATSLVEWEAASVRVHLPEQGDSGHITRGVGGCICPGSSAGAGRQWPHHSWSGRLHLSGFICRSRETVATSLVEWEAASVRGSSAGAGRQWPHHSWSGRLHLSGVICRSRETVATSLVEWEAASVRGHLPEQGDSGHITRGVGGCICPGSSAGAGRRWPHHSWSGGCICPCVCRSRETVATSLMEWEAASVHASAGAGRQWPHHSWSGRLHLSKRLPEQGDSGHITRGVGGCICPCVCRSRETVATSLMEWEAASVHASAGAGRQWPHHSWSGRLHLSMRLPEQGDSGHITRGVGGCICPCVCRSRETVATSLVEWEAASVQGHIPGGMQDCIWRDQVAACSTCITCTTEHSFHNMAQQ